MQVDRHVDGRLQAEQDRKPGGGEARERVLVAQRMAQRAQHDEGEQRDQHQAEHDAELLGRDREHEVGVALRQDALDRALARPAAEPAAAHEGFDRLIDVEGVARGRIEEALDAPRDVRDREIGAGEADRRRAAEPDHPDQPHAGQEEQRAPHQRDQHGLAEVGLQHQAGTTASSSSASAMVLAGISGRRADFAEQPGDQDHEGGLEEFRRLDVDAERCTSQRRAPLTSAPKTSVATTSDEADDEHDQRDAPDVARRQERGRQQHGERGDQDRARGG